MEVDHKFIPMIPKYFVPCGKCGAIVGRNMIQKKVSITCFNCKKKRAKELKAEVQWKGDGEAKAHHSVTLRGTVSSPQRFTGDSLEKAI